jgi:hypothetical protein
LRLVVPRFAVRRLDVLVLVALCLAARRLVVPAVWAVLNKRVQ